MVASPSPMAARMAARCEIDLSGGGVSAPRSGPAGSKRAAVTPAAYSSPPPESVDGYELTARVVASLSIAAMLYLLLVRIRAVPDLSGKTDIHERTGMALTATSLGFGVGMLYEIGAWASNGLFDAQPFTFDQLIGHMAVAFVASAAGAALLVFWDRAGWQTRRAPASMLIKPPS